MKHRIPFQSVYYLAIDGEAQLHTIQINSPGYISNMPTPGLMPMPGQMSMPGQMPMSGSHVPGFMPSAGHTHMPGVPPGTVPQYASGYNAYPGQNHNSPYLHVN